MWPTHLDGSAASCSVFFYSCCCRFGTRKLQIVEEMRCYEYELSNFHIFSLLSSVLHFFLFRFFAFCRHDCGHCRRFINNDFICISTKVNKCMRSFKKKKMQHSHFINSKRARERGCDFEWICNVWDVFQHFTLEIIEIDYAAGYILF